MYKLIDYWVPKYKWQVIDWLALNKDYDPKDLKRLSKAQCYAIYHKIRSR